jgi:hypothetical protein
MSSQLAYQWSRMDGEKDAPPLPYQNVSVEKQWNRVFHQG